MAAAAAAGAFVVVVVGEWVGAGRGCSRVVLRRPESSGERRGSHLVKDVDRCNRRVHVDRQPRRDLAHVLRRHRLVNRPLGKVVHHHLDALVRQRLVRRVGRALRPSLGRLLVVARVRLFELTQFVAFHLVRERTRVRGGAHAHTHPHRHPGATLTAVPKRHATGATGGGDRGGDGGLPVQEQRRTVVGRTSVGKVNAARAGGVAQRVRWLKWPVRKRCQERRAERRGLRR